MRERNSDAPNELEHVLQAAGLLVCGDAKPAEFLEWFRTSVPAMAPRFAKSLSDADGGSGVLIYGMGRALWSAMPQPSNRYRPQPLPKPDRNGRCPCSSGRKFKQCCALAEPPREMFESMNLLRYVLDGESKAALRRIDASVMDPAALDDVAQQWTHEGNFERALALLESVFDEGAKLPKHAEMLLDTLFDIWPPNHKPQRRRRLAERLANGASPAVACVAVHRCILMLADESKMEEAWVRFHAGMRQYPKEVNFAGLEITLLLRENRLDEAKRRAEFWEHWLRRQGSQYHPYAERLVSMAESGGGQGVLERLRDEWPMIDKLAELIESQPISVDGYAPRPTDAEAPIVLMPDSSMVAIERRWSEAGVGGKPALVMFDSGDEPMDLEQIIAMLEQDPALLHSFDVLDDISQSLQTLASDWAELGAVMELVLQRAETMLFAIVTGKMSAEWVKAASWCDAIPNIIHEMPWGFLENRPALRLMARYINYLNFNTVGSFERWLPRARVLLKINPNDNHGYREMVSIELLRQRRPRDAMALLDQYPDDAMGAIVMNRVLALFLLERKTEAASTLCKGGTWLREIRKGIKQDSYAKPRDISESGITMGGRDEAWFYRQDMRTTWKEVGAMEWLKQQPAPGKLHRGANSSVDEGA
ncbi:SEC-C metal-binding domain-containing protein [Granulosicoccus antarcticus]|uniref:Protein translocase subunit SecA n=1 Tax=Granulosicoccus antarcticus IMCC3135 TaxID=1192854 RepID=A0A2Z2NHE3_9GAMM|nr:SEC-C metal-binding domain-containing protein [Granulosicoccus antarcticus]ASJ70736.1 hypothetical protein IMCC3135_03115 [Granulosicoccus antarcticus IMCC3135]